MTIVLDISAFRSTFVGFSNTALYPDAIITTFWDISTLYISDNDYGLLNGTSRVFAIQSMTAHLLMLNDNIANGQTTALISASTIGQESITLTPPPVSTQFKWWLSTTPYGAQLLALLRATAVGGLYVGGSNERGGFRKIGGRF